VPALSDWEPQERTQARGLGLPTSMGDHLAQRALRPVGLWASPGSGRRRAQPTDEHRTNLTLAAAGDTTDGQIRPVRAAKYVAEWRGLELERGEIERVRRSLEPVEPGARFRAVIERTERMAPTANATPDDLAVILFEGVQNLGPFFDALQPRLIRLASPYGGIRNIPPGFGDELRLTLTSGPNYRAVFETVSPIGFGFRATFVRADMLGLPLPDTLGGTRSYTLTGKYFLLLAQLSDEMARQAAKTTSGSASSVGDSENTKAAPAANGNGPQADRPAEAQAHTHKGQATISGIRQSIDDSANPQADFSSHPKPKESRLYARARDYMPA
jgi:hypothetical protein